MGFLRFLDFALMVHSDEINLSDLINIFRKRVRLIVLFVFTTTFSAAIISLFLPRLYRAETTIITLGSSGGGGLSSMIAQLGGMALPGAAVDTVSPKLIALLQSRTLATRVIDRFNLLKVLHKDLWDAKNNKWNVDDSTKIPTSIKEAISFSSRILAEADVVNPTIKISIDMEDPQIAADVANGIADELQKFVNENAFSEEKKYRLFIGKQLVLKRKELLETSKKLSEYYQTNRISPTTAQIDVSVGLTDSENDSGTNHPVDRSQLDSQIKALEDKKLQVDQVIKSFEDVQAVPQQVYFQYLSKQLDILVSVTGLLSQQYEMAKIDEAKEDVSFQVLDYAIAPDIPSQPKKRLIVIVTFTLSLFIVVLYVFFKEYLDKIRVKGNNI